MTTAPTVDTRRALRDVLGRYATGVTVVTAAHRGRRAGVTVNSFTSVSLDPPLVLFCLHRASACGPVFTTATRFAVHVLAAGQQNLAARFAAPGDRFHGLPDLAPSEDRAAPPLLPGTVGTLVCRREQIVPAGDHLILLGSVLTHRSRPGPPLLFLDGAYRSGH